MTNGNRGMYGMKDEIIAAIDADTWQHSWHLPRDESNQIEWGAETAVKVKSVLESQLADARARAARVRELLDAIDWGSYE